MNVYCKKNELEYCPSCGGFGNHGFEEESGNEYICYACGGTGVINEE
jgi:DnaJ-class molecular chaperone